MPQSISETEMVGHTILIPGFGEEIRVIAHDQGIGYLDDSIHAAICDGCAFKLEADVIKALHKLIADPDLEIPAPDHVTTDSSTIAFSSSETSPYSLEAHANAEALAALVEAVMGPEPFDEKALLNRFPTREICDSMKNNTLPKEIPRYS